ncbi:hypothetical protein A5717_17530 [Mycolicibacterium porcinum]|uniref:DUF2652 domain-containing protein n=1 Tax=Mycolicibacterium porcinum TaxID=39693 RepID=UPI00080B23AD|nr:DUF2652 domain-containing protein [Mycolicibacterium porcinum]OCB12481.1 hypothetical protein A5717_17530 [Mycolicibacterium porcinum]
MSEYIAQLKMQVNGLRFPKSRRNVQDGYQTREGYLLIADISGYTSFLTGTELAHAQAIVHELTSLVRERLVPPMHFVKLEGDAVFSYADHTAFRDGERLLELIEVCYFDFSNRLLNMARNTTCPCSACAAIGSLDLKFVCHYGSFIVESEAGRDDLAGPDVILVHRLLKNSVNEHTGIAAYVLFTDACLRRLPQGLQLPRHEESYESFGPTTGGVHDLKQAATAMQNTRRQYICAEDADLVLIIDVAVPPAVAWRYWVDPVERQRWQCRHFSDEPDRVTPNALGRVGPGAAMHCNHGPGTWRWEFVDWQPFTTFTCEVSGSRIGRYLGLRDEFDTFEFTPTKEGGTHVVHRIRLKNRGRLSLSTHRLQSHAIAAVWRRWHSNLLAAIAEDNSSPPGLGRRIRQDT